MKISFEGRVVIVAGGTGGLGRAVSLAFLNEGAKVAVTYRREEELAALRSVAGANASTLFGQQLDVRTRGEQRSLWKDSLLSMARWMRW